MKRCLLFAVSLGLAAVGQIRADEPIGYGPATATYRVKHALTVKDIPADAKTVRIWFWLPDDDEFQKVRDVKVTAPDKFQVARDKENGHRYLYVAQERPAKTLDIATEFLIQRREASLKLDPDKAGPLTENHRQIFADYLRKDIPNMEVSDEVVQLANKICGEETNVVRQAAKIFSWVVANTDHYSKPGAPKSSGQGSVAYCLTNKGGGCTDQHAVFIALARARGIPTRLHFGSILREKNEGKDHNPGYRCWVQYYVPNFGWVSADCSEADTQGREDYYVSSLDARHIRFAEGRNLNLNPPQDGPAVNLFVIAYIEVDGKPHTAFDRVVRFEQVR